MNHPVDAVKWVVPGVLKANDYNPNRVFSPELKLLARSIVKNGWIQPLLILKDGTIIDGFHRWQLAMRDKAVRAVSADLVPVVILDVTPDEAMVLTVRMNRAKGVHAGHLLSSMVRRLHGEFSWPVERICKEIGATVKEVDALLEFSVWKTKRYDKAVYSDAWMPVKNLDPSS